MFLRSLDRLAKGTNRNLMKYLKGKCKVLSLGMSNPMHQNRLGQTGWKTA